MTHYHALQLWLLPPGINFLLLTIGLVFSFAIGWRKLGHGLMIVGIASLWLFSMPVIAYRLVNQLQNQYPALQSDNLKNRANDAVIVVLGGGDTRQPEYDNKQTVSETTLRRIQYAAYLHQQTQLPILVSGGRNPVSPKSEAELMAETLRENFNINHAYLEDKSLTTADESKMVKSILQEKHLKHIYLVTNAWHMSRSVYIFRQAGIDVIPAPMGYFVYGPGYALISYFPNMDALYASTVAIHEFLGLAWYRFATLFRVI